MQGSGLVLLDMRGTGRGFPDDGVILYLIG